MTELYENTSGVTEDSLAWRNNRTAAIASPNLSQAEMAVLNETWVAT